MTGVVELCHVMRPYMFRFCTEHIREPPNINLFNDASSFFYRVSLDVPVLCHAQIYKDCHASRNWRRGQYYSITITIKMDNSNQVTWPKILAEIHSMAAKILAFWLCQVSLYLAFVCSLTTVNICWLTLARGEGRRSGARRSAFSRQWTLGRLVPGQRQQVRLLAAGTMARLGPPRQLAPTHRLLQSLVVTELYHSISDMLAPIWLVVAKYRWRDSSLAQKYGYATMHYGSHVWREFLPFFKGHSQSPCTALTAGKWLPLGLCKETVKESARDAEPHLPWHARFCFIRIDFGEIGPWHLYKILGKVFIHRNLAARVSANS